MIKTKNIFKVEIRKTCKVCGKKITAKRFRSYCGAACRNKFFNKKYSEAHTEWNRQERARIAMIASPDKVQCLICKKWYVQVCTHIYQVHGLSGREYREQYDLEVKKGVVPLWYRKEKGNKTLENGTVKNLKKGQKFWFKAGSKTAGRYKRAPATIDKLKVLYKNTKKYKYDKKSNSNNK